VPRIGFRRAMLPAILAALLAAISVSDIGYAAPDYDGDGSTADDCAPLDPAVHPGVSDKPDLSFEDTNCDGIDGDLGRAIFVTKSGNDAGTGTKDNPVLTIGAGVTKAKAADPDKDVYVAGGTYTEVVSLQSAVGIYGGYAPGSGARSTAEVTIISAAQQGLLANNVQGVVLQLLTLRSTTADGAGNAYGLRAIGGASVLVQGVTTQPADGITGQPGAKTDGVSGNPGSKGSDGYNNADFCTDGAGAGGGPGGSGAGGRNGGSGGPGGSWGIAGAQGNSGLGPGGAGGGYAGAANYQESTTSSVENGQTYHESTMTGQTGGPGNPGTDATTPGSSGANGSPALSPGGGTVTFIYPAGATGIGGGNGNPGTSGGGGGGGGGVNNTTFSDPGGAHTNGGGGGGGGGAGGGGGGGGGAAGQASVARITDPSGQVCVAGAAGGGGGAATCTGASGARFGGEKVSVAPAQMYRPNASHAPG
jgi:hypothetical protein